MLAQRGEILSTYQTHPLAAKNHNALPNLAPVLKHVIGAEDLSSLLPPLIGKGVGREARPCRDNHHIGTELFAHAARHFGAELHLYTTFLQHRFVVPDQVQPHRSAFDFFQRVIQLPPKFVPSLKQRHLMSTLRSDGRGFKPRRPTANHHHAFRFHRRTHLICRFVFVREVRIHRAVVGQIAKHPRETQETTNTGTDLFEAILASLVQEFRIGKEWATHLPEVNLARADCLIGHHRIAKTRPERDGDLHCLLGAFCEIEPAIGRHVAAQCAGARFMPADDNRNHIHAGLFGKFHILDTVVGGRAAVFVHQLCTAQTDNHQCVTSDHFARLIEKLEHKARAILDRAAVFIGARVGERREEIGEEIPHERGVLNAVEACLHRAPCRIHVLLNDGTNLVFRHLARWPEMAQGLRDG